jgi:hypothetical protein
MKTDAATLKRVRRLDGDQSQEIKRSEPALFFKKASSEFLICSMTACVGVVQTFRSAVSGRRARRQA